MRLKATSLSAEVDDNKCNACSPRHFFRICESFDWSKQGYSSQMFRIIWYKLKMLVTNCAHNINKLEKRHKQNKQAIVKLYMPVKQRKG